MTKEKNYFNQHISLSAETTASASAIGRHKHNEWQIGTRGKTYLH